MSDHYVIVADQGHLRVFLRTQDAEQMRPVLREVNEREFPLGHKAYTDTDSDMAGRFQGSKHQGAAPGSPTARQGMSIDERLPMQREIDKRRNEDVGEHITAILTANPDATWDFAAPAELHKLLLETIPAPVRSRLQKVVPRDLVNQPLATLYAHFTDQPVSDGGR